MSISSALSSSLSGLTASARAAELVAPGDIVMVKGSNGSRAGRIAAALSRLGERG